MTRAALGCLTVAFAVLTLGAAPAAEPGAPGPITGTPQGQILAAGDNRVVILSPTGQVLWEQPAKLVHDAWMLPTGNVLFGDGQSITEVTPDHQVVFQYRPQAPRGDAVYACQRLPNGNTLVGENATGRILELDPAGKVVFTLQTQPFQEGQHHNLRLARKLASGNYLVCHSGAHVVKEYRPTGEVVREFKVPNVAFSAIRTPRNTTLIASLSAITEFDEAGQKVWEFTNQEPPAPGLTITNMTGLHLLPNGNLVIGCYAAYTKEGQGCGLLEITREKKVVWSFHDPKFAHSMMAVQMLDEAGRALPGECLR